MFSRIITASLLFCWASLGAQQKSPATDPQVPTPSLELLEFLADFGDIDPQTLELLEYHARRDRQIRQQSGDDREVTPNDP